MLHFLYMIRHMSIIPQRYIFSASALKSAEKTDNARRRNSLLLLCIPIIRCEDIEGSDQESSPQRHIVSMLEMKQKPEPCESCIPNISLGIIGVECGADTQLVPTIIGEMKN